MADKPELVAETLDILNHEIREGAGPLTAEIDRLKDRARELDQQLENTLDLISVNGDKSERTRKRLNKLEGELRLVRTEIVAKD